MGDEVQWEDLRYFLAVAQQGGLSPAARVTQSSPATMGRRMLALEAAIGQDLFIRHDRGYELTAYAREFLDGLQEVEGRIDALTAKPQSEKALLVKISAGTWTTLKLLTHMDALVGAPVDLRLRFVAAEAVLSITHRDIVIGFRNRRPTGDGLAGRKLARVEFAPFARADAPEQWIKVLADTPSARWLDKTVGAEAICEVNAPRNSLDLALLGQGIALLPTFIGDAQPSLIRVGATINELAHDQWIVTHNDDRYLPHVRRAIDRLCRVMTT